MSALSEALALCAEYAMKGGEMQDELEALRADRDALRAEVERRDHAIDVCVPVIEAVRHHQLDRSALKVVLDRLALARDGGDQ